VIGEAEQLGQVRRIFNRVAGVYDLLNHLLSLGEDRRWRRFVARCLRPGPTGRVLDAATGTGDLARAAARRPHRPLVVGVDLVPAMLGPARRKLAAPGLRAALAVGDATRLPFPEACFDAVTIAFGIRNIPRRDIALAEMLRVLAPGGRVYVLEFTTPRGRWVRAAYRLYLRRWLPWLGGLVSGDRASYQYLADTILAFPSPASFRAEMAAAGFAAPRSHPLTQGVAWVHVGERPLDNRAGGRPS
jgi:demethylmenaquinone methyltransferase/2-methoxy-6-polyprenyl-1,4-benzoquinol methylase